MKLWKDKGTVVEEVEKFTVGKDREFDMHLALYDVLGSIAHVQMLASVGLLTEAESLLLQDGLKTIHKDIGDGKFELEEGVEDIHSQVELTLTKQLGDAGKKIHMARSRNDQVLLDIRLFLRDRIEELVHDAASLFNLLIKQSEKYKDQLLPGYTHLQLAMPSSFGLWFAAYAESLVDDMITLRSAYEVVNKNPLGSAAGYGSSFNIDRELTTSLLGFDDLNYNVVYAQMGRGKTERIVAASLSNFAATLSKLSMDCCLYLNQNFGFISFPAELTTGSSIMPHKKNPDVFELIRAQCNRIMALPNEINMMTVNLPSGYHRDFQLLKESIMPAFDDLQACFKMTCLMLEHIIPADAIMEDKKYRYAFSVEEVNRLVSAGMPFRDAYHTVAVGIENNSFAAPVNLEHVHAGSIGNLCNEKITAMMKKLMEQFQFGVKNRAISRLTQDKNGS